MDDKEFLKDLILRIDQKQTTEAEEYILTMLEAVWDKSGIKPLEAILDGGKVDSAFKLLSYWHWSKTRGF